MVNTHLFINVKPASWDVAGHSVHKWTAKKLKKKNFYYTYSRESDEHELPELIK